MVYMFLADGFETVEALCPLDLLRRAGIAVRTVAAAGSGKTVTSSHGVKVEADILPDEIGGEIEMVILPGGPGAEVLDRSEAVEKTLEKAYASGAFLCAICAAPMILGKKGYLKGKKAVCFPGYEEYLEGAEHTNAGVVRDGAIITGRAMGSSADFGLELITALRGKEISDEIKSKIHYANE
jgi:4-methyl-5(b-hydroxyethyl)-thiazole monophosphate biosynthesis